MTPTIQPRPPRKNAPTAIVPRLFLPLTALLALFAVFARAGMNLTPPTGRVTLAWDYPTNELSTDLWFNIYETTNLAAPLTNWNCLTNVLGTNLTASVIVQPGAHFFVATASNFWGESLTSNVASTPILPKPAGDSLTIHRD